MNFFSLALKAAMLGSLIFLFSIPNTIQAQVDFICDDPLILPDAFNPECGVAFDLCRDVRTLDASGLIDIYVQANDELTGAFSSCDLNLVLEPGFTAYHGEVTKINDNGDCFFRYQLLDFDQNIDSFYYSLTYVDDCQIPLVEDYCTNGKIWTINSSFYGVDGSTVVISNKKGKNETPFATISDLQSGAQFIVDGTDLATNQTEWVFSFYTDSDAALNGGTPYSRAQVHTSCSSAVFGVDFGVFRPLNGCVSPYKDRKDCVIAVSEGPQKPGASVRNFQAATLVDARITDITVVVVDILILGALPIEFSDINGKAIGENNLINWGIASVIDEDYLMLQSSTNGKDFTDLAKFGNLTAGAFDHLDRKVRSPLTYYRFKVISVNGDVSFSRSISVKNNNIEHGAIDVYPNPAYDVVTFSSNRKMSSIEIFDMSGRKVYSLQTNSNEIQVSKSNLNVDSGIYYANIILDNNTKLMRKLTIL